MGVCESGEGTVVGRRSCYCLGYSLYLKTPRATQCDEVSCRGKPSELWAYSKAGSSVAELSDDVSVQYQHCRRLNIFCECSQQSAVCFSTAL